MLSTTFCMDASMDGVGRGGTYACGRPAGVVRWRVGVVVVAAVEEAAEEMRCVARRWRRRRSRSVMEPAMKVLCCEDAAS